MVERYPGTAGFLCVVEASVKPPSEELRQASSAMVRGHGMRLRCIAVVIEASGFMGALTRSVLAGMNLVSGRQLSAQAFFASVQDASDWLSRRLDLDPGALNACAAAQRAALARAAVGDSLK
jgi:hypothetical protein